MVEMVGVWRVDQMKKVLDFEQRVSSQGDTERNSRRRGLRKSDTPQGLLRLESREWDRGIQGECSDCSECSECVQYGTREAQLELERRGIFWRRRVASGQWKWPVTSWTWDLAPCTLHSSIEARG